MNLKEHYVVLKNGYAIPLSQEESEYLSLLVQQCTERTLNGRDGVYLKLPGGKVIVLQDISAIV